MSNTEESAKAAPGRAAAVRTLALDFCSDGLRGAVLDADATVVFDASGAGLAPRNLLTVAPAESAEEFPRFPGLLTRLGEQEAVALGPELTEKPNGLVKSILERVSNAACAWWGPCGRLAICVSAFASEPQRNFLVKTASACDWPVVRLVNRTTAAAFFGVQGRSPGRYGVVVLGYGGTEVAVVEWDGQKLSTLAHGNQPEVSGETLDRILITQALGEKAEGTLALDTLRQEEWLYLRGRAAAARERLNYCESVVIALPEEILGEAQEVRVGRSDLEAALAAFDEKLGALMLGCAEEAGAPVDAMAGCLVTGGLVLHPKATGHMRELFAARLTVLPASAQVAGAARLAGTEKLEAASGEAVGARSGRREASVALPAGEGFAAKAEAATPPGAPGEAESEAGPAWQELRDLKERLASLERSMAGAEPSPKSPAVAETPPAGAASPAPSTPAPAEAAEPKPAASTEESERKAQRMAYIRGRENLRRAERYLREGRLAEAVGASHLAGDESKDPQILEGMIKVHLRAARKRPPVPENFAEERRYLLCALGDDPSSPTIAQALAQRYRAHIEQILAGHAPNARDEAKRWLADLLRYVDVKDQVQDLLAKVDPGRDEVTMKRHV